MLNKIIRITIRAFPAELSHSIFLYFAKKFPSLMPRYDFPKHTVNFLGKTIPNYYGVAAGLDKNADCIEALFKMGFSLVEIGTVTPLPQYGNPKPRVFRLDNESILNYMGFPSKGMNYVLSQVRQYKKCDDRILGINIGRNKDGSNQDYLVLISVFHNYCDYITVNISSPNTPNLLDNLNNIKMLEELLSAINNHCTINKIITPILLKLSPDVTNIEEIYHISCKNNIYGFILTNTTVDKSHAPKQFRNTKMGGISGKLLQDKSRKMLTDFQKINIEKKPVISVGGIDSDSEAKLRISCGANFTQIYSGLIWWKN